ncbi:MAG: exodeoxyribonuclease III [Gammaproteobacteria bacterium]
MRIITVNVNGIRSAERKGFFEWLKRAKADVVCLQEIRAQAHQIEDPIFCPEPYHCYYFDAQKKGYSGVAIYTLKKPDVVKEGLGFSLADEEGRYIEVDFGNLRIISLYLPSGTSGEHRQKEKYAFMKQFTPFLKKWVKASQDVIICGDWNIAHQKIDLKNWKTNQKNSGFLPEERAWLDKVFDNIGWVDAFRVVNQASEQYTWWSHRGKAWENNTGWRIDYQIVTPSLKDKIKHAEIYKDERFSDHAPLIMDYDI